MDPPPLAFRTGPNIRIDRPAPVQSGPPMSSTLPSPPATRKNGHLHAPRVSESDLPSRLNSSSNEIWYPPASEYERERKEVAAKRRAGDVRVPNSLTSWGLSNTTTLAAGFTTPGPLTPRPPPPPAVSKIKTHTGSAIPPPRSSSTGREPSVHAYNRPIFTPNNFALGSPQLFPRGNLSPEQRLKAKTTLNGREAVELVSVQRVIDEDAEEWVRVLHAEHVARFKAQENLAELELETKLLDIAKNEVANLFNGDQSKKGEIEDARKRVREEFAQQMKTFAAIQDDQLRDAIAAHHDGSDTSGSNEDVEEEPLYEEHGINTHAPNLELLPELGRALRLNNKIRHPPASEPDRAHKETAAERRAKEPLSGARLPHKSSPISVVSPARTSQPTSSASLHASWPSTHSPGGTRANIAIPRPGSSGMSRGSMFYPSSSNAYASNRTVFPPDQVTDSPPGSPKLFPHPVDLPSGQRTQAKTALKSREVAESASVQRNLDNDAEEWVRVLHAEHVERFKEEEKRAELELDAKLLDLAKKEVANLVNGDQSKMEEIEVARIRAREDFAQRLKNLVTIQDGQLRNAIATRRDGGGASDKEEQTNLHLEQEINVQQIALGRRASASADSPQQEMFSSRRGSNASPPASTASRTSSDAPATTVHAQSAVTYSTRPPAPSRQGRAALDVPAGKSQLTSEPLPTRPPVTRLDFFAVDSAIEKDNSKANEKETEVGTLLAQGREHRPYSQSSPGGRIWPGNSTTSVTQSPAPVPSASSQQQEAEAIPRERQKHLDEQHQRKRDEGRVRQLELQRVEEEQRRDEEFGQALQRQQQEELKRHEEEQKRREEDARRKRLAEELQRREEQHRRDVAQNNSNIEKMLLYDLSNPLSLPAPKLVRIEDISSRAVAYGGFSDIYSGVWHGPHGLHKVALKVMRINTIDDEKLLRRFRREIKIWSSVKHPNVLPIQGLYFDQWIFPAMVSTWSEQGDIVNYLKACKNVDNIEQIKLGLLLDVLHGLEFLHGKNIIHADIKGGNVLISSDGKAQLSDFGLSYISAHTESLTNQGRGSSQWMAPELIGQDMKHSQESDIWSFGCLCVEVLVEKRPYHDQLPQYVVIAHLKQVPPLPLDQIVNEPLRLITDCCKFDVSQRPSVEGLLHKVTLLYQSSAPM